MRVASKAELEIAFCGDTERSVRVGCIRQDRSIPAMVRVDDLLGKHFAILGTTGTGKSCTTALILRSILEKNPAAHIVLLDPHNEYATAFGEWAEVISPRNMQLPFWLLNFEEIIEVLIGDPERKAEIEILQELIPIAKSRYSTGRNAENNKIRRGVLDTGRYTVDTPVPYRISDLTGLIDERMGKLENKKRSRTLPPAQEAASTTISQDGRYGFMFGSLTVYDGMTQVLGRIFRVPVNNKPITILELTGLPTEIVNVVVSVLCRMTFDFALWSEGQVPVTLVCEEAHRYVPANVVARLRTVQARHRQDRQGGPQVRRLAVHRHAASGRNRSRPSCLSATPCSRCAWPTTRTRRSCNRPWPTPARACWNSCRRSASAKRSRSATACRCRSASSSTNCPSMPCRARRRHASLRNGRSRWATKASSSRSSIAGACPASAAAT